MVLGLDPEAAGDLCRSAMLSTWSRIYYRRRRGPKHQGTSSRYGKQGELLHKGAYRRLAFRPGEGSPSTRWALSAGTRTFTPTVLRRSPESKPPP